MKHILFAILFSVTICKIAIACPYEDKNGRMLQYDSEFAVQIEEEAQKYLSDLKLIDSRVFENRTDISASNAVSLMKEVGDVINNMEEVLLISREIKTAQCDKTPDTLRDWVKVAKNISEASRYMDDIERNDLLPTNRCYSCMFVTVHLSLVFDFIEARIDNKPLYY